MCSSPAEWKSLLMHSRANTTESSSYSSFSLNPGLGFSQSESMSGSMSIMSLQLRSSRPLSMSGSLVSRVVSRSAMETRNSRGWWRIVGLQ